jgi:hypothetical protein
VAGAALGGIACHCRDCQYAAGGSANLSWIYKACALEVLVGATQVYRASASSGGSHFCGNCGVQLFSVPDSNPHLVAIKVGCLDDASGFTVQADLWMASAPDWHHPHDGALQYARNMPRE